MNANKINPGLSGFTLLVAALVVTLLLGVGGLWWWAGTQGSVKWALDRVARTEPLSAEGVEGSLRTGVRIKRLQWGRDGLKAEALDVDVAWEPLALIYGTVKLDYVRLATLRVEDRRAPVKGGPPLSLVIPLRWAVDEVKVGQLQWTAAANTFELRDLDASYGYNGVNHTLLLEGLRWAGGSYRGKATLGAHDKLPVDAQLEGRYDAAVPGSTAVVPLLFSASVRGPIADLQAHAVTHVAPGSASAGARATVTAQITPWAQQPVPQAQADLHQLDLGVLWPGAPGTSLAGRVQLQPGVTGTWVVTGDLSNALPGPWDRQRLPIERVLASGELRSAGQALVRSLEAHVGGGRIQASGEWRGQDGWAVEGKLLGINPAAIHTAMAPLPLSGRADVSGEGQAVLFDMDLKGRGRAVAAKPAARKPAKQGELAGALHALEVRQVRAKGRWADGSLSLPTLDVRSADAQLRGSLQFRPDTKSGSGRASLEAPGLQARLDGRLAERSGGGALNVSSANLGQALAWLGRLPGAPAALRDQATGGRGDLQLAWQGGWRDPVLQANLALPSLDLGKEAAGWKVRDAVATLNGRLSDAALKVRGRAELGQRRVGLDLSAQGGRRGRTPAVWQGQLSALNVSVADPAMGAGTWTLGLQRAFDLRWAASSFEAGAGQAVLTAPPRGRTAHAPAVLAWDPVRWRAGELRTAGRFTGLPMAWIELIGGPQLAGSALSGDLVFDAQWDASLGARPRLNASLVRSRGDLMVLTETADGATARVQAGVREARLSVVSEGEAITVSLRWDSERGGTADGRLVTRLAPGGAAGWQWPANAPLAGALRAQLPRIGVWSLLAPPGWRLRGSLAADVKFAGTRADPQLAGSLNADDLALRSVVDGVELQGGRLRARLEGRRLVIDEFMLRGPGPAGGTLIAQGEAMWTAEGPFARLTAEVSRLRASIRSDRQLTVTGQVAARLDREGTVVNGYLRADQAHILLPDETAPKLGDDVVVRGAAGPVTRIEAKATEQAAKPTARRLTLAVDLDLGNDFRVQGLGIDTRLRGRLALSGQSITAPRLVGSIRAVGGEYRAYGQRLDIERGVVRFTGPVDNPSLDILAIRPNMVQQRVGVQVTGQALAPFVRLYAEPDMPDAQKLSWLVTGRASAGSGAEAALVQQAALALLAGRSGSGKRGVSAALGLDEVSFKREGADGPSITLGKRFGRNFYAAYERSLAGALGTLYIFYDLTRRITLRAEAGERTAVDLIYTLSFD